jgi:uncharacterized DUF497 family protein
MQSFEWDDEKAEDTWRERGIHFEEAVSVFDDPYYLIEQDPYENNEERYRIIGMSHKCLLLLVVHTIREYNEEEVVRIISVRRANTKERRRYDNRKF